MTDLLTAAEPPITTVSSARGLRPLTPISARSPSQTVGTPKAQVTRSASISSQRLGPSSPAPGMTSEAPVSGAA